MSNTLHSLSFGICVRDSDAWQPEDFERYQDSPEVSSPEQELADVMIEAGNAFIRKHPHLFCGELV